MKTICTKAEVQKLVYNSSTGDGEIYFGNIVTKEKNEKAKGDKIVF